jgi:hypothetical protein
MESKLITRDNVGDYKGWSRRAEVNAGPGLGRPRAALPCESDGVIAEPRNPGYCSPDEPISFRS